MVRSVGVCYECTKEFKSKSVPYECSDSYCGGTHYTQGLAETVLRGSLQNSDSVIERFKEGTDRFIASNHERLKRVILKAAKEFERYKEKFLQAFENEGMADEFGQLISIAAKSFHKPDISDDPFSGFNQRAIQDYDPKRIAEDIEKRFAEKTLEKVKEVTKRGIMLHPMCTGNLDLEEITDPDIKKSRSWKLGVPLSERLKRNNASSLLVTVSKDLILDYRLYLSG